MEGSKRILRTNVRVLLERKGGAMRSHESGVTRLVNLGVANGTAQRILDEESDPRLSTLDELAEKLGVGVSALLSPGMTEDQTLPFRDLDAFEVQLVTFFRQLGDDERHDLLVRLNQRTATSPMPSTADPWADSGRRIQDVGHVPERRALKTVRR